MELIAAILAQRGTRLSRQDFFVGGRVVAVKGQRAKLCLLEIDGDDFAFGRNLGRGLTRCGK